MAERKPKDNDINLPFAALQLLAPPVRLVSAALWKVLKRRDVLQYGVVEEFVTSACENVPGLLTFRHQGKLALGLRGRLILELCHTKADADVITRHLERIRPPAPLTNSAAAQRKDVKILKTVESFHSFIHSLLTDPVGRDRFFNEQFPLEYGPKFDQELEKLLWEFLIRLDQLLPVPNLSQTVAWLSETPAVLEECAQAATQPQLLKILLQHQSCLGHLEAAASLPPNMGDSILASLSLPPSGKVVSNPSTESGKCPSELSNDRELADGTLFISPVVELVSSNDAPAVTPADKQSPLFSNEAASVQTSPKENSKYTRIKNKLRDKTKRHKEQIEREKIGRKKRKHADGVESDSGDEGVSSFYRPGKRRVIADAEQKVEQGSQRVDSGTHTSFSKELLTRRMTKLGIRLPDVPEDPSVCSLYASCLSNQPRVVVHKLPLMDSFPVRVDIGDEGQRQDPGRNPTRSQEAPQCPDQDNKENRPVSSVSTTSLQILGNSVDEDYVADSEDEGRKNFKRRLFTKRYYKTKHGTYVPTLREFWKPKMTQRDLLLANGRLR